MATANTNLDERPTKTPQQSYATAMHTVVHADMNGESRLFGGQLMKWIDDIAAICARLHAGGSITTASVDNLTFLNPAYLNDVVTLEARVTYVGGKSLEVRVDTFKTDVRTGERKPINTAYLTEVFMGDNETPTTIPFGLRAMTIAEKEEFAAAQKRIAARRARAQEGF